MLQALTHFSVEESCKSSAMKFTAKSLQKAQLDYLDELKRLIAATQKLISYAAADRAGGMPQHFTQVIPPHFILIFHGFNRPVLESLVCAAVKTFEIKQTSGTELNEAH